MQDSQDSTALREAAQEELNKQLGELDKKIKPEEMRILMSRLPDVDFIMREVIEKLSNMPNREEVATRDRAEVGGLAVYVDDLPSFNVNDPDIEVEIIDGKKHYRMRLEPFIELAQPEEHRQAAIDDFSPDEKTADSKSFVSAIKKEPPHKSFVDLVEDKSRDKGSFPHQPLGGRPKPD